MSRRRVLLLGAAGCAVGAAAVLALAAWAWLPSQQEAAIRLSKAFAERTGTEVDLGGVRWSLWPTPTLVVEDAVTRQDNPIVIKRMRLQGSWSSLLHRQPRVEQADLEGVAVSRAALSEFAGAGKSGPDNTAPLEKALVLRDMRVSFRDLGWIDRRHVELVYEGEVAFGADGLPQHAEVARAGVQPQARLQLDRQADPMRWRVEIDAGGGSWNGEAGLHDEPGAKGGRLRLDAALTPRDVDVGQLVAAFHRRSVVDGHANGTTTADSRGERWIDLLRGLHTHTRFVMKPARITRFDLDRAISTAGTETAGQTPLDQLSGVVETRNSAQGMEFRFSDLKASSGALSASGKIKVLNGKLNGDLAVDVVDGVVGVPMLISGTVQEPVLSASAGAVTGAAIGSAVLPGVGTALGARLGHEVERLLGGSSAPAGKPGGKSGGKAVPKSGNMGEPPNPERGPAR